MGVRGSLARANRGPIGVLWGQSNANTAGNNTGSSPLSLPDGATLYVDGVLQNDFSAVHHGVEVGILDELCRVGGKTATLFRYGVNGSSLDNWNATHTGTLIGHVSSAGVGTPAWGVCVQGEAEAAAGETQANDWDDDLLPVLADFRAAWGAAWACVFVRIRTTDAANYPHHAIVRANQDKIARRWPNVGLVHVDDSPLATDASGVVHYTSATAILAGRRAARLLLSAGLVP